MSLVKNGNNPDTDRRVAQVALERRNHLSGLAASGSIGLYGSIRGHEEVLKTIADRYGHSTPFEPSLLDAIPTAS
jgi:hypothetical protein